MSDLLSQAAAQWSVWIAAASWQVALMVLLVALVTVAARRASARFRYLMWLLVLVRLFTPPTLGAEWGVGRWVVAPVLAWSQAAAGRQVFAPARSVPASAPTPAPREAATTLGGVDEGGRGPADSAFQLPEAVQPPPLRGLPLSATDWLALGWLAGVVAFLGLILVRYALALRMLRQAAEVDEGPLRVTLERLALSVGAPAAPRLLLSEHVSSPFLLGVFSPRIVLPAALPGQLDPAELENVLLHELMHWRRRDLWAGWLQALGQALFWFHPLVWLAGAQLRHERECACDEAVLATGRSEPRQYGRSLLQVLLAAGGRSSATLGFLGIFERNARLQRRLEDIMNPENHKKRFGWPSRLFILLFTLACLPMAPVTSRSQQGAPAAAPVQGAELDRLLTEDQRLFNEWTETRFRSFFDTRTFPTLTPAERERLEAKLIDTLRGPKNREYYEAINTLAALKSRKAIPELLKIATDRRELDCRDRWMAIRALGLIGDPSVVPDLIHLVYYPNTNTHFMAQIALARLTGQNFGLDYKKWVAWWNAQGKEPKLSEEQIPWVKDAKYLDLDGIRESDREFLDKVKAQKTGESAAKATSPDAEAAGGPPRILATTPAAGQKGVKADLAEISVTFDRDMSTRSWSWTGGGDYFPPNPGEKRPFWRDARTCVLPVKLAAGHFYRVGINAQSFHGFQSAEGVPVAPTAIYFTTQGAGAELEALTEKPTVVKMEPENGAREVDPKLTELRVTFSAPMGASFSWCGGGPNFPETPEGGRPRWSEDRKTCILPVRLKPGWDYRLSLNSPSFNNFQNAGGVPLEPVAYAFSTAR